MSSLGVPVSVGRAAGTRIRCRNAREALEGGAGFEDRDLVPRPRLEFPPRPPRAAAEPTERGTATPGVEPPPPVRTGVSVLPTADDTVVVALLWPATADTGCAIELSYSEDGNTAPSTAGCTSCAETEEAGTSSDSNTSRLARLGMSSSEPSGGGVPSRATVAAVLILPTQAAMKSRERSVDGRRASLHAAPPVGTACGR
jgi:hypothetical protein